MNKYTSRQTIINIIFVVAFLGILWSYVFKTYSDIAKKIVDDVHETQVATESIVETQAPTEAPTEPTEPTPTEIPATEPLEAVCEPLEAPVSEETEPVIDQQDWEMLAAVIYQEAGSDSICDPCRYRVGDIVLNRVASDRFPDTIHGVLTQKGQYGRFSSTGVVWPSRSKNSGEKHAVERAYEVAKNILTDARHSEVYGKGYVWQAGFKQGKDNIYCCGHYYGR